MKCGLRMICVILSLICYAASISAQSPQSPKWEPNLFACTNGRDCCDRSVLTQSEKDEVAVADHQRNYMACASGYTTCDQARLTSTEANSLAAGAKTTAR